MSGATKRSNKRNFTIEANGPRLPRLLQSAVKQSAAIESSDGSVLRVSAQGGVTWEASRGRRHVGGVTHCVRAEVSRRVRRYSVH